MKFTKHFEKRKQQRGFSAFATEIILKYGEVRDAAGGAIRVILGDRQYQEIVSELKRIIHALDKANGGQIVIKDDSVLTIYK
jgi:hypothetical protein